MPINLADIEVTDVPEVAVENDVPEIACRVCGTDISLLWSGKGRKPVLCAEHKKGGASKLGTTGSATRASGDVTSAIETLELGYNALEMLLLFAQAPTAREALSASRETLKRQNETYLKQDKELVKKINSLGKTGSRAAFISSQVFVLGPVAFLAAAEIKARFFGGSSEGTDEVADDIPATVGGFPVWGSTDE